VGPPIFGYMSFQKSKSQNITCVLGYDASQSIKNLMSGEVRVGGEIEIAGSPRVAAENKFAGSSSHKQPGPISIIADGSHA
jgi:hypothetical protein